MVYINATKNFKQMFNCSKRFFSLDLQKTIESISTGIAFHNTSETFGCHNYVH